MCKLLIVEDEDCLRRSLVLFFRMRGYDVVQAASLAEADGLLETDSVEVALVDVCLPDGDGLLLCERLGAERAIAMTAFPNLASFAMRGVVHHMEKPLDLGKTAELVAAVAAA